ncbi:hypothetical protein [Streptomyces sp. NPDC085540]|uniref:hypothetical protein n=1 Tax=Streptomyces sp. NPDC085540 TaxID=3365730 RepID=UPI0037D03803
MTAGRGRAGEAFEDVIRDRTGADYVERTWLAEEIERALESERGQYVLVTGEPGAGKTSLLAGMARSRPDRLRYFFRRDSRTALTGGDIQAFLLSIGHQLARVYPEIFALDRLSVVIEQHIESVKAEGRVVGLRIDDLQVSPFHHTATLEVQQRIGYVGGSVSGIEIGTAQLEPRLLDPDNLAHLALIGPAQVLAEQDPEARIVILLDALDEIADDDLAVPRDGLLRWLARSPELPENIRIVMTSRPHSGLRLLRAAREERLTEVVIDPGSAQVADDLRQYADRVLETPAVVAMDRARGRLVGHSKHHAVRRAAGNFLYLATYARALSAAAAEGNDELTDRLLAFSDIPGNLVGLYGFFLELVREDIASWPRSRAGAPDDWDTAALPLIGVLTVAREALTEEQLAALSGTPLREAPVRRVLGGLRWLLERREHRIGFFHTSIGEFLTAAETREKHPECWVDAATWHRRIAQHYRGSAPTWADVDWPAMDRYGLAHLVTHLLKSGPPLSDDAAHVVCPGLRRAARIEFGSDGRFQNMVDRIAHQLADGGSVAGLPALTYLGVVRGRATRSSDALPPRVIGLLARTGRLEEALERVAAITPSQQRITAVEEILRYARPGPGKPSTVELLDLLVECALIMPRSVTDPDIEYDAHSATQRAARLLAPYDLERALRLWQHAQNTVRQKFRTETEPDEVFRAAAAATPDVAEARTLIDRMSGERWADHLDLAERAGPGATATELLREAERGLRAARPPVSLLALARLAAAWTEHRPDTGRRLLAEVRAEVFAAGEHKELAEQLPAAARVLADVDRATARCLLARLDTVEKGNVSLALLDAARLWTRWGEHARAGDCADRYLAAMAHEPWAGLDAREALGRADPEEAMRTAEHVHAQVTGRGTPPDAIHSLKWDAALIEAVRRMAAHDLGRAARMARDVRQTAWFVTDWPWRDKAAAAAEAPKREIFGLDQFSVRAGIAHIHVARGETTQAVAILDAVLREAENPETLGGGRVGDTTYARVPAGASASSAEASGGGSQALNLGGAQYRFNMSEYWAARVRERFFRAPADIVRAVDVESHSRLDRVVRRFAERVAPQDLARAGTLVGALENPGERAIGYAILHRLAHGPDRVSHHGPEADAFSQGIDRALGELPRYRWTVRGAGDEELGAWVYTRPDHRVRFELAVRALGCREKDMEAIERLPYLARAHQHTMAAWVSSLHATLLIDGQPSIDRCEEMHRRNLTSVGTRRRLDPAVRERFIRAFQPVQAPDLTDILAQSSAAAAAYHEYRLARSVPGYVSRVADMHIDDPVYGAAVDIVTPAPGAPLSPAFVRRLRELLDKPQLPAAAELLAYAAEVRPDQRPGIRELAAEVTARAGDGSATGVEALSVLACSPSLGDLVDPVRLLHATDRCVLGSPDESWIPGVVTARLFPVLLERAPAVALHKFYEIASTNWSFATGLLEHAAELLTDALGADAAVAVCSAAARGLACTSPEGSAPDVVDGVRLERLVGGGRRP